MKRFLCVVTLLSCLFLHAAPPVWADAVFDNDWGKYRDEGGQMTLRQMCSGKCNGTYRVKYYDSYFGTWLSEYEVFAPRIGEGWCTIKFYAYPDENDVNKVYVGCMSSRLWQVNGKDYYIWSFYSPDREEIAEDYREDHTEKLFPDELPVFQLFFGEQE